MSVPEFDLLAASLRADTGDLKAFVEALADKLTGSFPERVKVERKGRLLGGDKRVKLVSVSLGDQQYLLENDAGHVVCHRRNMVRGIALRTEELPLERWIDELSRQLLEEAGKSESDRAALARMLEA